MIKTKFSSGQGEERELIVGDYVVKVCPVIYLASQSMNFTFLNEWDTEI